MSFQGCTLVKAACRCQCYLKACDVEVEVWGSTWLLRSRVGTEESGVARMYCIAVCLSSGDAVGCPRNCCVSSDNHCLCCLRARFKNAVMSRRVSFPDSGNPYTLVFQEQALGGRGNYDAQMVEAVWQATGTDKTTR